MQARTWILVAAVGCIGFIARRSATQDLGPGPEVPAPASPVRTARALGSLAQALARPHTDVDRAAIPTLAIAEVDPDDDDEASEPAAEQAAAQAAQLDELRVEVDRSRTSGIVGQVTDVSDPEPVPGVTVVVSSPAMEGAQVAITDEHGVYRISALPPGDYHITFYANNLTFERDAVVARDRATAIFEQLDLEAGAHEVPASEYTIDIPTGRTFESVLGAAAGSQGDPTGEPADDDLGISFTGTTTLENTYEIDVD
jgi:hypothetical protein